jgi:hypothetical protein
MAEHRDAELLAQRVLERPSADPDDDLALLARQFLRRGEVVAKLKARLAESRGDPMLDMIHANRDAILQITEEGLRRVKKCLEMGDVPKALRVIEAVNTFHPMHGESWGGWPE